jgi:hypothetical protein
MVDAKMQAYSTQGAWLLMFEGEVGWTFIEHPPIVDAWLSNYRLRFWCKHCVRWHHHAENEGHRRAHCVVENSPYNLTGYVLRRNTRDPRPKKRDQECKLCAVCHDAGMSAIIFPRICRACTAHMATKTQSDEPARRGTFLSS